MSPDDDFPPTQAAPPPPPEPAPSRRESRANPHASDGYAGLEQALPARTWKENPLIWIVVVVAMFMAVPLLASMATGGKTAAPKPRVESAAAPAAEPAPAPAVPVPAVAPTATNASTEPAPSVNQLPPNMRPQSDASRQVITKCYENGRVVYTQTGACTGSMSAVPIDTSKNVVGPGGTAPAGSTR